MIELSLLNICDLFSRIWSTVNKNLLRATKICSQLCYGDYHQGSRKQASAVFQNYHYFRHNTKPDNDVSLFFAFGTKPSKNLLVCFRAGIVKLVDVIQVKFEIANQQYWFLRYL